MSRDASNILGSEGGKKNRDTFWSPIGDDDDCVVCHSLQTSSKSLHSHSPAEINGVDDEAEIQKVISIPATC